MYKQIGTHKISEYSNSDYVGNKIDRKSTYGYCAFVEGNIVTWRRKKQTVIAHTSVEDDYRAMAHIACELLWVCNLI